jgi:LysM domain.
MAEDYDYEDDDEREERRPRRGQPRFGSFVTIAAAILMLFGAASRVGKVPEVPALFGIDRAQENYLQEQRERTVIQLGAIPSPSTNLRPPSGSMPVNGNAMPPIRDVTRGHPSMSLVAPDERPDNPDYPLPQDGEDRFEPQSVRPLRPSDTVRNESRSGRSEPENSRNWNGNYVVARGDTWVKIAKLTLGDGSRWQELQRANPAAKDGLKVGMRLVVPN